ncbi:MAG: hypothetical protein ABSF43_05650 [Rectinemataceae bacterium]|jgi:hypothetical protein
MLREILALLGSGGTSTLARFALDLGIDRGEVEDMLRQLSSFGYIEELSSAMATSCADGNIKTCAGCSGCGFVLGCGQAPKNRVWALTPKGREVLKHSS